MLKETAEGKGKLHTQRYNTVLAKLNQSKAITRINSKLLLMAGLINTVMMLLKGFKFSHRNGGNISRNTRELAQQSRFLWAGGTYAQAFALIQFLSKKMSAGHGPSAWRVQQFSQRSVSSHNGAAKDRGFHLRWAKRAYCYG